MKALFEMKRTIFLKWRIKRANLWYYPMWEWETGSGQEWQQQRKFQALMKCRLVTSRFFFSKFRQAMILIFTVRTISFRSPL